MAAHDECMYAVESYTLVGVALEDIETMTIEHAKGVKAEGDYVSSLITNRMFDGSEPGKDAEAATKNMISNVTSPVDAKYPAEEGNDRKETGMVDPDVDCNVHARLPDGPLNYLPGMAHLELVVGSLMENPLIAITDNSGKTEVVE